LRCRHCAGGGGSGVALAIALIFYNSFNTIDVDRADQLQG